jgi:hypothetical protein
MLVNGCSMFVIWWNQLALCCFVFYSMLHSYYALYSPCFSLSDSRSISEQIENKSHQQCWREWRMLKNWSTTPQTVGGGGGGMKRGSALSHAIPNARNKMGRKEHELLWVTTDELPWPCLGHAKVSGVTQSNVAPLAHVGIPVWHWVMPIALAWPSSILHHNDWRDKKWLELGIIFLWDHF